MLPIDERVKKFDFRAWPTYDTLPAIYRRCRQMLVSGRSVTIIRYYVPEHPDQSIGLEVAAGLRLDQRRPIPLELAEREQLPLATRTRSFGFHFDRCEAFGLWTDDMYDELTAARRFHTRRRDTTQIKISGLGEGVDDHIEITQRNEHGVVTVTRIQLEDRDAVHPTTTD